MTWIDLYPPFAAPTFSPHLEKLVAIVDDYAALVEIFGTVLREHGFGVITAGSGDLGLAAIQRGRPRLALLNLVMPRISGYELCEAIRSDPKLDGMFIVLTTAMADPAHRSIAADAGANALIRKPIDHAVVVRLATIALGRLPGVSASENAERKRTDSDNDG